MQTAVNDEGFEINVIRRVAMDGDPHPLPMSGDEEDLWAVQVSSGNQLVSARRHEQMVVSARGDMALMCTVHPLDFICVKTTLAQSADRDPLMRPKDRLQAQAVQLLWDEYLSHRYGSWHPKRLTPTPMWLRCAQTVRNRQSAMGHAVWRSRWCGAAGPRRRLRSPAPERCRCQRACPTAVKTKVRARCVNCARRGLRGGALSGSMPNCMELDPQHLCVMRV